MVCPAGPSGVRRPPWEILPSRRPIVQRPRADCEDDPEPGTRTSRKKGLAQRAAIRRPLSDPARAPCSRSSHYEIASELEDHAFGKITAQCGATAVAHLRTGSDAIG